MSLVKLNRTGSQRIRGGHLWVYRGEVARQSGPGPEPEPGTVVDVVSSAGEFLGRGFCNPRSNIVVRLLTRDDEQIDDGFLARRLKDALDLRALLARTAVSPDAGAERLVFGEGDRLPGLIVDRYADYLVVQALTAGMDARLQTLCRILTGMLDRPVAGIVERDDVPSRRLEGLDARKGVLAGDVPPKVGILENGASFEVDLLGGQKTGHFLDQSANRRVFADRCSVLPGGSVLDAFCHTGGFGILAAKTGRFEVTGIEISPEAVELARANAASNGVSDRCNFLAANAFDAMHQMDKEKRRFDAVVVDPPAFTRTRDTVPGALRGYKEINLRAVRMTKPGGLLVTCTCSHHIPPELFLDTVRSAAADAGRDVQLLETRGQSPDHPVLLGVPETRYLTCLVLRVL